MERVAPLVLFCAALFTVAAASASISPPFLAHSGSASSSSSSYATEAASQVAKPLERKGKTVEKYVAKLRPTVVNGKVIGCKGASGKVVLKTVRYSATSYYYTFTATLLKLQNGGVAPSLTGYSSSCTATPSDDLINWKNITTDKEGRAKRYSFIGKVLSGPSPLADARRYLLTWLAFGKYYQVGYTGAGGATVHALCGKMKKKM